MNESSPFFTTIAFDPGGATGWAVSQVHQEALESPEYKILDNITHMAFGEFYGDKLKQVDDMLDLVSAWPDDADVVVESFILRVTSADLSPVEVTWAFKYGLRWPRGAKAKATEPRARSCILQQPSMAMSVITDDRLKAIGYYNPTAGLPHARDAIRHNLTWLRRKKEDIARKRERESGS